MEAEVDLDSAERDYRTWAGAGPRYALRVRTDPEAARASTSRIPFPPAPRGGQRIEGFRPTRRSPPTALVSLQRVEIVEAALDRYLAAAQPAPQLLPEDAPLRPGTSLTARVARELFEDQALSRTLDVVARELKRDGRSFYTISSSGHEQNACLGRLLEATDPCFLHYRSGALVASRSRKRPGTTRAFDALLSLVASADDPISGGRHKVFGSRDLWIPPQTSTIASHLPKAVGMAFALSRSRRLGRERPLPSDSIVMASFGDASANHATALAGFNAARYSARKGNPTPVLFVCEDNGIGISVPTPSHWIRDSFSRLENLRYFEASGDLVEVWNTVELAIHTCRASHAPVFLHLNTVRLFGHAGSDLESGYRTLEEIERVESLDPLLENARLLIETGAAAPSALQDLLADTRERIRAAALEAVSRPKLTERADVLKPLAPFDEAACRAAGRLAPEPSAREATFTGKLPELRTSPKQRTLAAHLNAALADAMLARPDVLLFGEDVGRKGGVYGVTMGLHKHFGSARVFDTLLDETTILGVAQGAAQLGFLPIPEIQYLAYLHNALDQLRGEACSLAFFSNGQFTNPMVVRIAGFAYQKGFGGHFHNDNSMGALRDIPGLAIAAPSRGVDAVRMLRGAIGMAAEQGRVVAFLEPIALYHEADLFAPGDGLWLSDYPHPDEVLLPGEVGIHHPASSDLLLISYANGVRLSLRAAKRLAERGIRARVLDLRWLNPLPREAIAVHVGECAATLVVDECRETGGGPSEAILSDLLLRGVQRPIGRLCAADSYVPLGGATDCVLVTEDQIVRQAEELVS